MSDEGEKTCPLCAEEMDLTDQQLRPCKCGYDICVWCWHHIMDMAEKDATEGRCPACRTPYNKEKIVGTASKCERLVAEMSVEKKQKSQKGKTKTTEGRKQLSSVRVIQRNLVYIVGLPLNLADEDLLQKKEYFGQYGKVLKVSISRTAAGTIQHFANNTCSVYITYAKEDEAVRSIQSVHGFVLDGRPLRACFGTTKYCHAWLRSMPCTNPDCLYLHEFGSQEDSFTKDEIISEYTRGRVQQVTGATTEMQRRSGNMLPPAPDDFSNNTTSSWAKPITKTTTNDTTNSMKSSPPNSSSGRSVALPAAASWGTRASNSQPLTANIVSSNGPTSKQKLDNCTTLSFPTPMVGPTLHTNEIPKKESPTANVKNKLEIPESSQQITNTNHRKTASETPSTDNEIDVSDEEKVNQLSSDMSSLVIDKNHELQSSDDDKLLEPFSSSKANKVDNFVTGEQSGLVQELQHKVQDLQHEVQELQHKVQEVTPISEVEADLLSFNNQRLRDPEVITHTNTNTHTGYVQNMPQSSSHSNNSINYSHSHSPNHHYSKINGNLDPQFGSNTFDNKPLINGFEHSNGHLNGDHKTTLDLGENSIISNILSMDFDPWDESLTSPQNLAKLLGDGDKHKIGDQRVSSSSRKTQNCNQSRFSFAREDEFTDQGSNFVQNLSDFGVNINRQNYNRDFVSNTNGYVGQLSNGNGFSSSFNFEESDRTTASNHSSLSSNKISVSRSQISAPPGFMGPSRAPPPGFTSNERMEQTYDNLSGNHMFDSSSLLRKMHQAPAPVYNNSVSELEFMDPAILAVGGRVPNGLTSQPLDMRSNFPSQINSYENDNNRLRLLVQRSFTQQNQRLNDFGDNNLSSFSQRTDGYGIPSSRIIEQNNRLSQYQQQGSLGNLSNFQQSRMMSSNGHWGDINNNGWNEVQNGNEIAMAEILRNERLGLSNINKYYSNGGGYEDTTAKYRMPTSGDMYNRSFGI